MNKSFPQTASSNARRQTSADAPARRNLDTPPHPITVFVALLMFGTFFFLAAGCKKSGAAGKPADVDYYTCTMHPSVKSQDPKGKCPICGMDLVPVMKKGAAMHDHASHSAQMPPMPGMPMEGGA